MKKVTRCSKSKLRTSLLKIGPALLKSEWKQRWTTNKPTTGYCYLVSEVLWHYLYPESQSFVINLGKAGTHWFIKHNGKIIDWTSDQFTAPVPYHKARRAAFFLGGIKTKRGQISKKAAILAEMLNIK